MKGRDQVLEVGSPLRGWCAPLDDSPDPVFRGRMLGDGVSIDPTLGELRAPFDAEVLTVPASRHAVNLRAANGAEFLVHVGIDTVKLDGAGFAAHVRPGERVKKGQLLLEFDMEKLLRTAASLRTPVLLLQSEAFSVQRVRPEGMVEFGDAIFEIRGASRSPGAGGTAEPRDGSTSAPSLSRTVVTGLTHGIHARPAARLIEAIGKLDARVTLHHEGRTAGLESAVALMSLGTHRGSRVTVSATGEDAQLALEAVVAGLEPLAGSAAEAGAEAELAAARVGAPIAAPQAGAIVRALAASPGLARGRAFVLGQSRISVPVAGERAEEQASLNAAVGRVRELLEEQAAGQGGLAGEIARAHLVLLADPMLVEQAQRHLEVGLSASVAWQRAVEEAITVLSRLDDPRMRERADDLKDINLRVQRALAGEDPADALDLPVTAIVVAENLLPSQLLQMDRERLAGICLAAGGATSHVAILAASMGVPMLVAAGEPVLAIPPDSELLIDAELGELHVQPAEESAAKFSVRMEQDRLNRRAEAKTAREPCVTRDGVRIHLLANIGSADDARAAVEAGAEGCGLLRTEFVFMECGEAPGVGDQLTTYQAISNALGDRPLVIRTLDAGGDKPMPCIHVPHEENPALGIRGIRLGLLHRGLLETQLRALLELRHPQPVRIMLPMVSALSEIEQVRECLDRIRADGAANPVLLGVMIETPAAALIADRLAEAVDFFSIGTNDLTQYTLCMDRGEPALAGRLDTLHPGVLALIRSTVRSADRAGIPVAVCGGAAGDALVAPLLLGLGVRELSMPASLIARQKARLRAVSIAQCEQVALLALEQGSARAVRAIMREFLMK